MILGLDLSLNNTGWYIINPEDASQDQYGGLTSPPDKLKGVARLAWLETAVSRDLYMIGKVELVIVEGYSYGARNQAHQVGEWGGIARLLLMKRNLRTVLVSPNSLKQFATGNGMAQKDDVKLWAFKRWGLEFKSNDICDACVLAMMGLALDHQEVYESLYGSLTQVQHKALSSMELLFAPVEVRLRVRAN